MNTLSPEVLAQIFAQESDDPYLILVTLSHPLFDADVYLVNNSVDITSRGIVFKAFPLLIQLPVDDGETARTFTLTLDNSSLELIEKVREVTTQIQVKVEMILATIPDAVQMEYDELGISAVTFNAQTITATIAMDGFLDVAMTSEIYGPTNFPGIFQ